MTTETVQHPRWIVWCMDTWTSVLALVHHIVREASEKGVDIAATAIGIAAPLPNAISVYKISQVALEFNAWQAGAFALAIELVIFVVVEIALRLWTHYYEGDESYRVPLIAVCASGIVGTLLVIVFVLFIELGHGGSPILAALPLLSLTAFVAVATKRWHTVQQEKRTVERAAADTARSTEAVKLREQLTVQSAVNSELYSEVEQLREQLREQLAVNSRLYSEVEQLRVHRTVQQSDNVYTVYKNGDILHGLEDLEPTEKIVAVAQRQAATESGINKTKIAELVGVSRTTVYNALKGTSYE